MARDTMNRGIASGQESPALARNRIRQTEIRNQLSTGLAVNDDRNFFERSLGLNETRALKPDELATLNKELAELKTGFQDIATGAATIRGEARLFNESISSEAKNDIEEDKVRRRAAGLSDSEAANLRSQRAQMQELLGQQPNTQGGAITSNVLTSNIAAIDAILKAREGMQSKAGAMRFADLTAVGGGGVPASVNARQDAQQKMVDEQKETNLLLKEIARKEITLL